MIEFEAVLLKIRFTDIKKRDNNLNFPCTVLFVMFCLSFTCTVSFIVIDAFKHKENRLNGTIA